MRKTIFAIFTAITLNCAGAKAQEPITSKVQTINHLHYGNSELDYHGYAPSGGMFFSLEGGQIAFFNPIQFKKFRTLRENGSRLTSEVLHFWNSKTHSVRKTTAKITFEDQDVIKVNGKQVTAKSLNRLRLTRNWSKVLQTQWPSGCSILNLGQARFLISGGNQDEDSMYLSKVLVYNAETSRIEKQFDMNYGRVCHSTTLLPNGKVFCLGGESDIGRNHSRTRSHFTDSAEILDITN